VMVMYKICNNLTITSIAQIDWARKRSHVVGLPMVLDVTINFG
jgi:hypothetical protein